MPVVYLSVYHSVSHSYSQVILAFPCNQFNHEEDVDGEGVLSDDNSENGSQLKENVCLMENVEVNGEGQHEVFTWLKTDLPFPLDDEESLMPDPKLITWSPLKRTDIASNFEKFLVDQKGIASWRYSASFPVAEISGDLSALLCEN